jgi:hypothetical protein
MKNLPCPFCGAKPVTHFVADELVKPELPKGFFAAQCSNENCHASIMTFGDTRREALDLWNRRAPTSTPEAA